MKKILNCLIITFITLIVLTTSVKAESDIGFAIQGDSVYCPKDIINTKLIIGIGGCEEGGDFKWYKNGILQFEDNVSLGISMSDYTATDTGIYYCSFKMYDMYENYEYTDSVYIVHIIIKPCSFQSGTAITDNSISIINNPEIPQMAIFNIYNIIGMKVYTTTEENLPITYSKIIDMANLTKGIYFVEVIMDGERKVRKIIKE